MTLMEANTQLSFQYRRFRCLGSITPAKLQKTKFMSPITLSLVQQLTVAEKVWLAASLSVTSQAKKESKDPKASNEASKPQVESTDVGRSTHFPMGLSITDFAHCTLPWQRGRCCLGSARGPESKPVILQILPTQNMPMDKLFDELIA